MDPALLTLAGTAGTALVQALTTDAWETARHAIVSLWQRHQPAEAESVSASLDRTRRRLTGARPEQAEEIASQSADMWRGQLRDLLFDVPAAADDLREVVRRELAPLGGSGQQHTRDIKQSATVKGGISIQAGHDANVNLG